MGWTIHYTVETPLDSKPDFAAFFGPYNERLHEGCEKLSAQKTSEPFGINVRKGFDYYWGFTKVHYSQDGQNGLIDFRTIVMALQALHQANPGWRIHVSDDYDYVSGDVSAVDASQLG
jgi:hypothetical protein